jgi:hypothetical protein
VTLTSRLRKQVEKLSAALSKPAGTDLVAAMSSSLDVLEALDDDDLELSDEDVALGQQLLGLLDKAKARVFAAESDKPPDA